MPSMFSVLAVGAAVVSLVRAQSCTTGAACASGRWGSVKTMTGAGTPTMVCCSGGSMSTSVSNYNGVSSFTCSCSVSADDDDDDKDKDDGISMGNDLFGNDLFGNDGDNDFLDGLTGGVSDALINTVLTSLGHSMADLERLGIDAATLAAKAGQGGTALAAYLAEIFAGAGGNDYGGTMTDDRIMTGGYASAYYEDATQGDNAVFACLALKCSSEMAVCTADTACSLERDAGDDNDGPPPRGSGSNRNFKTLLSCFYKKGCDAGYTPRETYTSLQAALMPTSSLVKGAAPAFSNEIKACVISRECRGYAGECVGDADCFEELAAVAKAGTTSVAPSSQLTTCVNTCMAPAPDTCFPFGSTNSQQQCNSCTQVPTNNCYRKRERRDQCTMGAACASGSWGSVKTMTGSFTPTMVCCSGGSMSTSLVNRNGASSFTCSCSVSADDDDDDKGKDDGFSMGNDLSFGNDLFGNDGDNDFLDGLTGGVSGDALINTVLTSLGHSMADLERLGINAATLTAKAGQGMPALAAYLTEIFAGAGGSDYGDNDYESTARPRATAAPCVPTFETCCTCPGWYAETLRAQDPLNDDDFTDGWNNAMKDYNKAVSVAAWLIVIIILVVIGSIGGCIMCCICATRNNGNQRHMAHPGMPQTLETSASTSASTSVNNVQYENPNETVA